MPEDRNARLERLKTEIEYDKLTVSYSIEGRDPEGLKKFCQFSVSVSCKSSHASGWSPADMPIVKALVSKQVLALTYKDAHQRKILSRPAANSELKEILQLINDDIQKYTEPDDGP